MNDRNRNKIRSAAGFTILELLVVIGMLGILTAISLPAVNAARERSRRNQCASNLKQLGLAFHGFSNSQRSLPTTRSETAANLPQERSWVICLAPYFEQQALFDHYSQNLHWSAPANLPIASTRVQTLECPTASQPERLDGPPSANWTGIVATSDYAALTQVDPRLVSAGSVDRGGVGMMPPNAQNTLDHVRDGLSTTILVTESSGRPWIYRGDVRYKDPGAERVNGGGWARPATDIMLVGSSKDGSSFPGPCPLNCTNGESFGDAPTNPVYGAGGSGAIFSFHASGVNSVMGDGSVRFLHDKMDIRVIAKLVTRAGGELITGE
jgi:type II secretory pathway pseudopilin PulG